VNPRYFSKKILYVKIHGQRGYISIRVLGILNSKKSKFFLALKARTSVSSGALNEPEYQASFLDSRLEPAEAVDKSPLEFWGTPFLAGTLLLLSNFDQRLVGYVTSGSRHLQ
jgi:hypothetical protein